MPLPFFQNERTKTRIFGRSRPWDFPCRSLLKTNGFLHDASLETFLQGRFVYFQPYFQRFSPRSFPQSVFRTHPTVHFLTDALTGIGFRCLFQEIKKQPEDETSGCPFWYLWRKSEFRDTVPSAPLPKLKTLFLPVSFHPQWYDLSNFRKKRREKSSFMDTCILTLKWIPGKYFPEKKIKKV